MSEIKVYVCENGKCDHDRIKPHDQNPSKGSGTSSRSKKCNACNGTMKLKTIEQPTGTRDKDWSR